jgi:type IV secretory pathway VirB6-like protein
MNIFMKKNIFQFSKNVSLLIVILLTMVLSACAGADDPNKPDECSTFDEIFDVNKLNDITGIRNGERIEVCDVDPSYSTTPVTPGVNCKGITSWVYYQVQKIVLNSSGKLWESIAKDDKYKNLIAGCIVLVIMFYGLTVMLGMTQVSGYSALMVFLKIALVYMFATQWDMFEKYVINTFEAIVDQATSAASNVFITNASSTSGTEKVYGVLNQIDLMIAFVWDPKVMRIIIGLVTAGASGFFWAIGLFAMTVMYLLGVLNALKIFIISLVGRYVLYALGPIFLVFALFNQTRSLFEGWTQQIISFTLQPVFLFIFLGIFHALMAGMIVNLHKSSMDNGVASRASGAILGEKRSAVCSITDISTGVRSLKIGNCDVVIGCGINDSQGRYITCKCIMNMGGVNGKPGPVKFTEVKGLGGKIDLSFIAILSIIIISYMLMPMANWVVQLAATISGGNVSAGSAQIAGMQRLEQEVSKGAGKIMQSIKKEMGGDGKANRPE